MTEPVLAVLRALGFGGFLGAGIFGIIHILMLRATAASIGFEQFVLVGGLLGAGFAHLFSKFSSLVFAPVVRFLDYYRRRLELYLHVQADLVKTETAAYIDDELTKQHFLGDRSESASRQIGFK